MDASLQGGLSMIKMEQVTSAIHLQVPAQPSPADPNWLKGGAGPRLSSTQACEQAGPLEASVTLFVVVFAGAVILILMCAVLLLCYKLRWAHNDSLEYLSFYHSARYTLKEHFHPHPQPAPPPPSLPLTLPLPPPPPPPSHPTPLPPPPFHPTPQPPPFHPTPPPPFIHTTPPSPLLPMADMAVYSRIGLMRTSRPPSASGSGAQVIMFEHSSL